MNASKLDDLEVLDALSSLERAERTELEVVEEDETFYVSVGEVVADKYRIEGVLGAGGMGVVLSAKHVSLGERFALKFLNPEFLRDEVVIQRFTQEARAACRIRNEHVARVYDVGVHHGAPFLVMEHLDGRDLASVVREMGALRIDDAVEYTMQACEALADAHRQGIVHRDIKPENLFLVEQEGLPSIKVLDFGISKTSLTGGEASSRLTGQLTLGTPCYMSPEQIRSTATAEARSDLWSLGAVLYELLSGVEAFRAATVTGVCAAVLEDEPEPLTSLRPEIPRGLVDVIARCLAKSPADRYSSVAELAAALLPFAPPRALVSVERSSSLMRSARIDVARERHISAVRPTGQPSSLRGIAIAIEPSPVSNAPLWRSVDASDVPDFRRSRRFTPFVAVGAFMAVVSIGLLAYSTRGSAPKASTTAVATPLPPEAAALPAVETPVAVRIAPSTEHPVEESNRAIPAAGVKRPAAPVLRARATATAAEVAAAASPSAAHPAATPSSRAAPSTTAVSSTAPTGSPTVELGY